MVQEAVQHHMRHFLGLSGISLEEGTGANAECLAAQLLFHRLSAHIETGFGELLQRGLALGWLYEHLLAVGAAANQHLWPCVWLLAEHGECPVDLLVGDGAGGKRQHAMRSTRRQARLAAAVHGEAHVIAVVPGSVTRLRWLHGRIVEAADLLQEACDHVAFPCQLGIVAHMLKLATSAGAKDRAGSRDAQRRGCVDFLNPDAGRAWLPVAALLTRAMDRRLLYANGDNLAGQTGGNMQSARVLLTRLVLLVNLCQYIAIAGHFPQCDGIIRDALFLRNHRFLYCAVGLSLSFSHFLTHSLNHRVLRVDTLGLFQHSLCMAAVAAFKED